MNKGDYESRKKAGLCIRCGQADARSGRVLCQACAAKSSAYGKTHRAQNNACVNAKRERNRASGLCIHCGQPARPGSTSCEECLYLKRTASKVKRLRGERWRGLFSEDVMEKLALVIAVKYATRWVEEIHIR